MPLCNLPVFFSALVALRSNANQGSSHVTMQYLCRVLGADQDRVSEFQDSHFEDFRNEMKPNLVVDPTNGCRGKDRRVIDSADCIIRLERIAPAHQFRGTMLSPICVLFNAT